MGEDPLHGHPRYETIRRLSRGGIGFVCLARDNETNEQVAIKFLPRGQHINGRVMREIMNHKHLCHPHVIQFKEVFLTDHYLAIVMEYAPGGNLYRYIRQNGGISEGMARWFFQQLIIGLDYIHLMGVANRYIKLENTLLDNNPWPVVLISNFVFCKHEYYDSAPHSFVGTRPYMAPEVVRNFEGEHHEYDGKKADIWSCGVLLYAMLVGQYPFEHQGDNSDWSQHVIHQRIMSGDYHIPPGSMSDECADLIKRILVVNPQERLDIPEIQQHPWYQQYLPEGALEINDYPESQPAQSDTEIMDILEEARNV